MTNHWDSELKHWIGERARALGFDHAGVASVSGLSDPDEARDAARFEGWVNAGRAGEMDYLKRRDEAGRLLRTSVEVSHPWAKSVVVCAMSYATDGPLSIDETAPSSGWIARYAWSGKPSESGSRGASNDGTSALKASDYHDFLLVRLEHLARDLSERAGGSSRCYVDTGPLVERSLASRAGIGWIGKNTCVLNQGTGSWLLLGVILSSLRLPSALAATVAADRCGSCTRCIDACPTDALTAPREMDASLCIAYLTIEKKGAIPVALRAPMGRQVFGCDICQDVCPWNRHASTVQSEILPRQELVNPDLKWLAEMDAPTFNRWFKSSPLERTRRSRLHRNVAIAMGNSGQDEFLPYLERWSTGEDPVLAEASAWAIERISTLGAERPKGPDGGILNEAHLVRHMVPGSDSTVLPPGKPSASIVLKAKSGSSTIYGFHSLQEASGKGSTDGADEDHVKDAPGSMDGKGRVLVRDPEIRSR